MSDIETKQGSVTATVSGGTKKDSVANVAGSQADPKIEKKYMLDPKEFEAGQYSKVGVTIGLTKSLGNFEFARIDITAEDFCSPTEKRKAWDALQKEAANYVVEVMTDFDAYLKDKKAPKEKMGL